MNVRPGTFESDMGDRVEGKKMDIQSAASVIMYAFDNCDKIIIRDIVYESI
jgi:hypothetical protein